MHHYIARINQAEATKQYNLHFTVWAKHLKGFFFNSATPQKTSNPTNVITKYATNSIQVLKYNPQLDGLRFCAVLSVVCYHWLPVINNIKVNYFFGALVNFFFVLSSYLITRILFNAKEKSCRLGTSRFKAIGIFLLRRTIRIFPAYYFFLLLLLLLPTIGNEVRNNAGMYFSYLANYHIFQSHVYPAVTAHIWTLAVEEQFYFLWPILIIFIPHRHLLKTFVAIIISSVILRAVCYYPAQGIPQDILTQYCVDAFAVGGLLAFKYKAPKKEKLAINKYFNLVLYAGLPFGVLIIITQSYYFSFVLNKLLFSMVSFKIIEGAVIGYKHFTGRFLQNKVVIYLGKISYGIYLYHLVVPVAFWKLYDFGYGYVQFQYPSFFASHQKGISLFQNIISLQGVYFIIYSVLVVAVAIVSSKLIEMPFLKLKSVFHI